MANEVAPRKETAVTNWEEELAREAKEVAKLERPSSSHISLKSGLLSYQGQPVPNNKLQVIILDVAYERNYYTGRYDPANVRSPVCFAIHHLDAQRVPHEDSVERQNDDCDTCQWNKWGTAVRDGMKTRGKACQERRRFILIPAHAKENLEPDSILSAEVATLKTPVTSVKLWGQYVTTLASLFQRPPFGVITEIGAVPNQKNQFNLTFKVVDKLENECLGAIMQKREMSQPILYKPYDANDDALDEAEEEQEPKSKKKFDK